MPRSTSGCWLWTRCRNQYGYGTIGHKGRPRGAHRLSYEVHVGPIPAGLQIDHLCRVRHCVNPEHLEVVTQQVNISRGFSREMTIARHRRNRAMRPTKPKAAQIVRPKAQPTVQILMRLPPLVAKRVRGKAKREGVSINAWLTAVIEQALAAEKR